MGECLRPMSLKDNKEYTFNYNEATLTSEF